MRATGRPARRDRRHPPPVRHQRRRRAQRSGSLVRNDLDPRRLRPLLRAAGVLIEPLTVQDAALAGALRSAPGGRGLSLGDRCCLSLALRHPDGAVLTADRAWALLDLPLTVRLIR